MEFAKKNERTNKIKLSHKFLFDSECDRSNRQKSREFAGINFQTDSSEFKQKVDRIQAEISLNELITSCNLHYIDNEGSLVVLITRLII